MLIKELREPLVVSAVVHVCSKVVLSVFVYYFRKLFHYSQFIAYTYN